MSVSTLPDCTPGPNNPNNDNCGLGDEEWVMVLPTDERCVPQDHPRANARLITEQLLVNRAASASYLLGQIHLARGDRASAAAAFRSTASR